MKRALWHLFTVFKRDIDRPLYILRVCNGEALAFWDLVDALSHRGHRPGSRDVCANSTYIAWTTWHHEHPTSHVKICYENRVSLTLLHWVDARDWAFLGRLLIYPYVNGKKAFSRDAALDIRRGLIRTSWLSKILINTSDKERKNLYCGEMLLTTWDDRRSKRYFGPRCRRSTSRYSWDTCRKCELSIEHCWGRDERSAVAVTD
jgi:hypothetical protein